MEFPPKVESIAIRIKAVCTIEENGPPLLGTGRSNDPGDWPGVALFALQTLSLDTAQIPGADGIINAG